MKKFMKLKLLGLLALTALPTNNAQAMKKFLGLGKSSSSKETSDDRLTRKIEEFSRAQAAARSGEGSPRSRDARAAELKNELKMVNELKPEHKEALAALHKTYLPQGKERTTSAHQPYSVRKEIEKAIPELRDARLGANSSEAGAARTAASASGRGKPAVTQESIETTSLEQTRKVKETQPITVYPDLTGNQVYSKSFEVGGLKAPSAKEQERGLEKIQDRNIKIINLEKPQEPSFIKGINPSERSSSSVTIGNKRRQSDVIEVKSSREPLKISEPINVVRKPSIPINEMENVLKDANKDLRTAEKNADKARSTHMAYEDKLRKEHPLESEIFNKRDFEKARIEEITKNLAGDSAQTRKKIETELKKAIESGDTKATSEFKRRLDVADEKILEQKKDVVARQGKLDEYEKIAQGIDPTIIKKFNAAEDLKINRLAAEEQRTKLGLEVNTINQAIQEAKKPTTTVKSAETSTQEETIKGPIPVKGKDRTGVSLPPQSEEEAKLTQFKTNQPTPVKGTDTETRTGTRLPRQAIEEKELSQFIPATQ